MDWMRWISWETERHHSRREGEKEGGGAEGGVSNMSLKPLIGLIMKRMNPLWHCTGTLNRAEPPLVFQRHFFTRTYI